MLLLMLWLSLLLLLLRLHWAFSHELVGLLPLGRRRRKWWTTKVRLFFRAKEGEHVFRSSQEGGTLQ